MSSRPIPLFYNPAAGRGRAGRLIKPISRELALDGVANEPIPSRGHREIESMVRNAIDEGHRQVIVMGGDGSISEAVNGILARDKSVALGVIPAGTGNDFAKASTIPLYWEHAVALLADRITSGTPPRAVDVGVCNSRYFVNGAGIGFDAKVSVYASRLRIPIGDLVYVIALLWAMGGPTATPRMKITYGNDVVEGHFTLANVANGPWIGGMFNIVPEATNDDGLLDLVLAKAMGRRRIVSLLPKLLRGTHLSETDVLNASVRKCTIVAEEPVISQLDGEVQPPQTEFSFEIVPGELLLL